MSPKLLSVLMSSSLLVEPIRAHTVEAVKLKILGNERLKNHLFNEAREAYIQALKSVLEAVELLQSTITSHEETIRESEKIAVELDAVKAEIEEVRLQLISNLSLTELKLEMWRDALTHASMVLTAEPLNAKSIFRRAVARIRLGEQLDEALADLTKLTRIDNSAEIQSEISKCKERMKETSESVFQSNIREKMNSKKQQSSTNWMESFGTWFTSFSAVMAQCGGTRPETMRKRRSSKK